MEPGPTSPNSPWPLKELWKDSAGEKPPSDWERRRSVATGFPRFALRGEQVYMRLNSVLKAWSLFWWVRSEVGDDTGFKELMPTDDGPWESWPEGPPGNEKSSEVTALGLSKLEGSDRSRNWGRGMSKSVWRHGWRCRKEGKMKGLLT